MKYFLCILWSLIVAYIFYTEQTYYLPLFENWKLWLPFVLAFGALHFAFAKIFAKRKVGLGILLILTIIFSLVLGGIKFFSYDYSRLEGVSIIQTDSGYEMISGEPAENDKVLISEGEIVTDTSLKTDLFPPQVSQHFVKVKPWILFNLEWKILLSEFLMIFFICLLAAIGSFSGEGFLISAAIGLLPLSIMAFAMAKLGIFSAPLFALATMLLAMLALQFWKKFLPEIKTIKINYDWKLSLTLFFLSLNLIDIIKVIPFAWDDLNVYSRYERLIAELAEFPHGIGSFAWTNIASAAWLFSHNIFFSSAILFTTSILGFFALSKLLKRFYSGETAWIISLLFYTLPFVVNQQVIDMKTDLPLFFVSTVAVDKFLDWIEGGKKKDLIILSILLGLALAIKITAFLLIAIIICGIIWKKEKIWTAPLSAFLILIAFLGYADLFAGFENLPVTEMSTVFLILAIVTGIYTLYKKGLKNFFIPCLILVSISLSVLSPWMIYNYFDSKEPSISKLIYGETKLSSELDLTLIEYCKNPYEIVNMDYDRYTGGFDSMKSLIALFWNTNFTPNFNNPVVDFSIIFLVALGFFIMFPKKLLSGRFGQITLLTACYIVLWMLMANGVIWYGIAGFIGTLILIGQLLEKFPKKHMAILFGLIFLSNFLVRVGEFAKPISFANSLGLISQNEITEYVFPGYLNLAKIINNTEGAVLYRVGTLIPYFINLTDEEISNDHDLANWICIQSEDDETIKNIFKKNNITNILLLEKIDPQFNNANYKEAHRKLLDFLNRSGWKLQYNKHGLKLYEIN